MFIHERMHMGESRYASDATTHNNNSIIRNVVVAVGRLVNMRFGDARNPNDELL